MKLNTCNLEEVKMSRTQNFSHWLAHSRVLCPWINKSHCVTFCDKTFVRFIVKVNWALLNGWVHIQQFWPHLYAMCMVLQVWRTWRWWGHPASCSSPTWPQWTPRSSSVTPPTDMDTSGQTSLSLYWVGLPHHDWPQYADVKISLCPCFG